MRSVQQIRCSAPPSMSREAAELLAVRVLTFLGSDEERLGRFLRTTGLTIERLRDAAASPVFLLGLLDYVAGDEDLLRAFAIGAETHPQAIMSARAAMAPKIEREATAPTGSIVIQCEHCSQVEIRRRRDLPHAPANAARVKVARCGPCGGGFDGPETWLDGRGNEVA